MSQFKWQKQRPTKGLAFPTAREGATLTFVRKYNMVVLFGGISNGRQNDIMIFDIQKDEWRVQATQGRQPSPRCYHCGFYDELSNNLFYYAGQGDKGRSLADFYCLNVSTWVWKRLFILEVPPNRHSHTVCDYGMQEKVIFGGACLPEDLFYNDVWLFNYSAVQFTTSPEIPGAVCVKKICKGEIPSGRAGHGATVFQGGLFVFGGRCTDDEFNIYRLQLDSCVWKRLIHLGKAPSVRAYFTANQVGDKIIVFGGSDVTNKQLNETFLLSLTDYHWSAPFTAGQIPTTRSQHFSCVIEDIVLIMGGLSQTYCGMDMYFLSQGAMSGQEWEQINEPTALEKQASEAASKMIMENKMYLEKIEGAMIRERQQMITLQSEVKSLQEEADNLDAYIAEQTRIVKAEHTLSAQTNQGKELAVETIFLMIKQEQLLNKQLLQKQKLLEDCLQNQSQLMIVLDQFYQSIRKVQGTDPRDVKIKKLAESCAGDIQKSKDSRLESIYVLTAIYKAYEVLSKRNEIELDQSRLAVGEINPDFEQLIFETEHE